MKWDGAHPALTQRGIDKTPSLMTPHLQNLSLHPVSNKAMHYLRAEDDWADKMTAFSQGAECNVEGDIALRRHGTLRKLICCCWHRLGRVQTSLLECWSVKRTFASFCKSLSCVYTAKVSSPHSRGGWELERTSDWSNVNRPQVLENYKCALAGFVYNPGAKFYMLHCMFHCALKLL